MNHSTVKGISVVIPNYNGRYLLEKIILPLQEALQNTSLPSEIIVSDDRSIDDSVSFLQSCHPSITVIINEKNLGFAPTINKGVFTAKYSHLLLLNSDVMLTPDYFSGLIRYFEKEDTFGVMGRIIGWDDDLIQDGGKYPYFHGLKIKTSGNYVPVEEKKDQWLYSMYLSGANAFVDREKILQLGGFDELFAPYYVEDYELSVRAWRLGWKSYYDHNSICRHKESVTVRSKSKKHQVNKIYYRNKMYLHGLHLPSSLLLPWHAQLFVEGFLNLVALRFYYLRAIFQYVQNWPVIHRKRKEFNELAASFGKKLLSLKQVTRIVLDNINQVETRRLK